MRTHFLLFALCLGLGTNVLAQNSAISGTVTDPDGLVVGATVKILQKNNLIKGANTDIDGFYYIGGLYPGDYNIVIKKLGYKNYKSALKLHNGQVLEVSPTLKPDDYYLLNEVVITTTKLYIRQGSNCHWPTLLAETISKRPSLRLDNGTVMTATALPFKESKATNRKLPASTSGMLLQSDFISKHPTRMW